MVKKRDVVVCEKQRPKFKINSKVQIRDKRLRQEVVDEERRVWRVDEN